jgi:2-methylisocitrate lyase-like PEP mutase family enzyme
VSVGFVLSGLFAAAHALTQTYAHLLEHGGSTGMRDQMMDFDQFAEVLGLDQKYAIDERFRPEGP